MGDNEGRGRQPDRDPKGPHYEAASKFEVAFGISHRVEPAPMCLSLYGLVAAAVSLATLAGPGRALVAAARRACWTGVRKS